MYVCVCVYVVMKNSKGNTRSEEEKKTSSPPRRRRNNRREREREKNGGKKETQHAEHEEEEKEAKRRRDLDQPQSIYRACNDTSPRNRFARETERETWRGPSIRELDEESGIESARDGLGLEGGTEGAKEREREEGRGEQQAEKRSQSAREGWKMSKKRRHEQGRIEKQKIREEGIRTRMEIEWRRNGFEGSRIEREKERIRVSGKCTRARVSSVPGVE